MAVQFYMLIILDCYHRFSMILENNLKDSIDVIVNGVIPLQLLLSRLELLLPFEDEIGIPHLKFAGIYSRLIELILR